MRVQRFDGWAGVVSLMILFGTVAVRAGETDTARDEQVMVVLDQDMDALNELDLERHAAAYHFPHYRHASGEIASYDSLYVMTREGGRWGIRGRSSFAP